MAKLGNGVMTMAQILLVDPNGLTAEHAMQVMIADGHVCGSVASAEEAMRVIVRRRPDILLLEDMLPGARGISLLRNLRLSSSYHDLPVIMLTAAYSFKDEKTALEFGAQDYILKPFTPSMLQFRVRQILETRGSHGKNRPGSATSGLGTLPA